MFVLRAGGRLRNFHFCPIPLPLCPQASLLEEEGVSIVPRISIRRGSSMLLKAAPPPPSLPPPQASLLEEGAQRAEGLVKARQHAEGLVVVASLLDNLPNLAGLCRCVLLRGACRAPTWRGCAGTRRGPQCSHHISCVIP